jgi:hypothetical protein
MAEIGIPVHVIALVLNHVDGTPPERQRSTIDIHTMLRNGSHSKRGRADSIRS